MFGYMTDLSTVEHTQEETIEASGHDLHSLLYNFMDECLFAFSVEPFIIPCMINITEFDQQVRSFILLDTGGGAVLYTGHIEYLKENWLNELSTRYFSIKVLK